MGVEFSLYKTGKPESYLLGKPAFRQPPEDWERRIRGIDPAKDFNGYQAVMFPSERAMWLIGTDGDNTVPFKPRERWEGDRLADLVMMACLDTDDAGTARLIADDILRWAGDDELLLVPDSLDYAEIAQRHGLKDLDHEETGSRYDVG